MMPSRERRISTVVSVGWIVVSSLVLWATIRIAVGTTAGQQYDDAAMRTFSAGREARMALLSVLGRVSIGLILVVMVACIMTALLRGRLQWAVGAVVVIAGANITTQLLKNLALDRPDLAGLGTLNSLPSGHTTVVASATAAALLVVPPVFRAPLALAGAAATTLTGASTIVAGWHRPSDIVAALAVSLAWAAVVSLVVARRLVRVRGTAFGSLVGAAVGAVGLIALGVRPDMGWDGALDAGAVLGGTALATAIFTWAATTLGFDDVPRETSPPPLDDASAVRVSRPALASDRPWS
ncbi:phosphatase PAP2 family protein [Aeromicrobium sp. CF3.5]|uniref:phosphatase PAP2 family protein n=1 Tax=Aeromicrobium sp. CF3.5 TaxID=3373078 RepID=UPI003EE7DF86